MKIAIYILMKYYDKGGTKGIAYESAIMAILLLFFCNILAFLKLTNNFNAIDFLDGFSRIGKMAMIAGIFIPVFFIIKLISPEQVMVSKSYNPRMIRIARFILIIYILVTFITTLIVPFIHI